MDKIRVTFTKLGRIRYISHLDLNRFMQRALRRSGLPVKYTEGFNPHIRLNFALPLSLGYESRVETFDFRLSRDVSLDEIKEKLSAVMPEGMEIVSVREPTASPADIAFSEYMVRISAQGKSADEISELFDEFMLSEKLLTEKHSKSKKNNVVDIKPHFEILVKYVINDDFVVRLKAPSGNIANFNPNLLVDLFVKTALLSNEIVKIERNRIICSDGKDFF